MKRFGLSQEDPQPGDKWRMKLNCRGVVRNLFWWGINCLVMY